MKEKLVMFVAVEKKDLGSQRRFQSEIEIAGPPVAIRRVVVRPIFIDLHHQHRSSFRADISVVIMEHIDSKDVTQEPRSLESDLYDVLSNWLSHRDPIPKSWKVETNPKYEDSNILFPF